MVSYKIILSLASHEEILHELIPTRFRKKLQAFCFTIVYMIPSHCSGLRILLQWVEMKLQTELAYIGASLGKELVMGFFALRMTRTFLQYGSCERGEGTAPDG
jgi:hypothetical protein